MTMVINFTMLYSAEAIIFHLFLKTISSIKHMHGNSVKTGRT